MGKKTTNPTFQQDSNTSSVSPSTVESINDILKKNKISVDDLIRCGKEGLLATKEGGGFDEEGEKIEVPDYNVRHKYFDSFLNLLGLLKSNNVNVQVVQISTEEKELMEAYRRGSNS